MQFVKPDIQTVCLGQAASAAAVLLAAGTPGKRLALPNSRILIHQPYTEGTYGQASDMEIPANEILRMRALLEKMLAEHSGKPLEKISGDIERDKILTAEARGGVRPDRPDRSSRARALPVRSADRSASMPPCAVPSDGARHGCTVQRGRTRGQARYRRQSRTRTAGPAGPRRRRSACGTHR